MLSGLVPRRRRCRHFFFFNDTATTEIYTLSLHDALPISRRRVRRAAGSAPPRPSASRGPCRPPRSGRRRPAAPTPRRSEEHTSELQSLAYLVCRLLLEKKKERRRPARRLSPRLPPRAAAH